MSAPLRRNQFGLSAPFTTTLIVAFVCSVAKVYDWHPLIAGAVLLWILLVANRRFWVRFGVTVALMVALNLTSLMYNVVIALAIATVAAWALRKGWGSLLHRVRVWGVEHLEPDAPPPKAKRLASITARAVARGRSPCSCSPWCLPSCC